MANKIIFTESQQQYIRENYPHGALCDIAEHLGVSPGVVANEVKRLGLKKSSDWSPMKYRNRFVKSYKHGWYNKEVAV